MRPTAKQRIERAVEELIRKDFFHQADMTKLILAERARLKRGVRKLRDAPVKGRTVLWPGPMDQLRNSDTKAEAARAIYNLALNDILTLWEG